MADKLGLNSEVRELKIGASFLNSKTAFHTLRYDFKPASVVTASKHATVEIGPNQEVTVTHLDTSGTPQTVFKGPQRAYQKECVLIIDRTTGEITLEKLTTNVLLKKTRQEKASSYNCSSGRPTTPVEKKPSPPQSNKHNRSGKAPSGAATVKQSPLHISPYRSPTPASHTIHKSPPSIAVSLSPSPSAGSLPLLGIDDVNDNSTNSFDINNAALSEIKSSPDFSGINFNEEEPEVGILSESSSDSSSDSNSSDSESDNGKPPPPPTTMNGHMNGTSSPSMRSMPDGFLTEDLQLSESGSDSD